MLHEKSQEILRQILNNEDEYTSHKILWDSASAVLWGKCIVLTVYISKKERSNINHLNFHLRKLEKGGQFRYKANRRNKILKINAEVNELKT